MHVLAKGMLYASSRNTRLAVVAVGAAGITQVALGISTLLLCVPIDLASAHQAGSLALLSASLWLLRTLRRAPVA